LPTGDCLAQAESLAVPALRGKGRGSADLFALTEAVANAPQVPLPMNPPLPATRSGKSGAWLDCLMEATAYPHPVRQIRRLETHISHVFLTGHFAYKIKKAVDLGFLDFSSLARRRFYCQEELRLNRRLAPDLYLAVVPIADTENGCLIGGPAPAVEYTVKMLEFPQSALLDAMLTRGAVTAAQIDALADRVARFHGDIPRAGSGDDYGTANTVWTGFSGAVAHLRAQLGGPGDAAALAQLSVIENWARREYGRRQSLLTERKSSGFVRECHGDLHLGNIAWWPDEPQIFDGIEFSPNLRWIDTISEIAFTSMDLAAHGRPDLAWRFLNRYLEGSGDYDGLQILPFYEVYRAIVRAMVARIRAAQQNNGGEAATEAARYLAHAEQATKPRRRLLILMHGLSGAGKTTVAEAALESIGAIRIRADVERKRLAGLPATARGDCGVEGGIYSADSTRATYNHLVQLARRIVDAGFPVVVDAASLQGWQRAIFRSQALAQGVPFRLLSCRADEAVLFERVQARAQAGGDASDAGPAVLRHQLQNSEPLSPAEERECLVVDGREASLAAVLHQLVEEAAQ